MNISVRKYTAADIPAMVMIWNQVVEDGVAFPQENFLDEVTGKAFFDEQTYCGVAVMADSLDMGVLYQDKSQMPAVNMADLEATGSDATGSDATGSDATGSEVTGTGAAGTGAAGSEPDSSVEQHHSETVLGLYILHPNNLGRCGHICNASYAVRRDIRGLHIGEKLVLDCLRQGREEGFGVLQFNAVVAINVHARHLYERLGFQQLGTIPKGFRMKDGHYEDICPYYHEL